MRCRATQQPNNSTTEELNNYHPSSDFRPWCNPFAFSAFSARFFSLRTPRRRRERLDGCSLLQCSSRCQNGTGRRSSRYLIGIVVADVQSASEMRLRIRPDFHRGETPRGTGCRKGAVSGQRRRVQVRPCRSASGARTTTLCALEQALLHFQRMCSSRCPIGVVVADV